MSKNVMMLEDIVHRKNVVSLLCICLLTLVTRRCHGALLSYAFYDLYGRHFCITYVSSSLSSLVNLTVQTCKKSIAAIRLNSLLNNNAG